MGDAGFFRGTSIEQDARFMDKKKKLMKSMKFPPVLDEKVDMQKVAIESLKPWVAAKVTQMLGFEDEVLSEFVVTQLEKDRHPDGKEMQINLTGFLERKTPEFMAQLWTLLLSAQETVGGVPAAFLEQKKNEIRMRVMEEERIQEALRGAGAPAVAPVAAAPPSDQVAPNATNAANAEAPARRRSRSRSRDKGRRRSRSRSRSRSRDRDRRRGGSRSRSRERHRRRRSRSRSRDRARSRKDRSSSRDRRRSRSRSRDRDRRRSRSRSRDRARRERRRERSRSRDKDKERDRRRRSRSREREKRRSPSRSRSPSPSAGPGESKAGDAKVSEGERANGAAKGARSASASPPPAEGDGGAGMLSESQRLEQELRAKVLASMQRHDDKS